MKKPHHLSEKDSVVQNKDGSRYVIYPRGLNIVWGDDSRYWNLDKSSTEGIATLIQVSWLDVSGVVDVEKGKKYRVTFEVKLKPDAFGWTGSPVLVMAKPGKRGKYVFSEISLTNSQEYQSIPSSDPGQSQVIVDVPLDSTDNKLYFGLYEVWSGKWKGGLQIKKVKIDVID
ncbi:hypothetical protein QN277_019482 [Acacia crassicarpa]|uniref:Protein PHLOEM PROTEIN 2-LIKE A9-like n=1 Tax=Acacia crassicarpa TaxID=499986 RepID=A0AAE1JKW5_9FABA|nr:hypothetical protein QN277_019482 [Acacia crassicarpa]